MNGHRPPRPTGSDRESLFMQWVWDSIVRLRPVDSSTAKAFFTTKGFGFRTRPGKANGLDIKPYSVKQHTAEYLRCGTWDGTDVGDDDINIAKPPGLRYSIAGKVILGIGHTYGNYDPDQQTRTDTFGGQSETQQITEPYDVGVIIYAANVETFLDGITLMDLNLDARYWARISSST